MSYKNSSQLEETLDEGYGAGGKAIVVEVATDNKHRTFPEVKHAFSKAGGAMAEPGSVLFQFERRGIITVGKVGDADDLLLQILDAGADDASVEDDEVLVFTDMKTMHAVRKNLLDQSIVVKNAELGYVPTATVPVVDQDTEEKLFRLLDALDDLDDVTNVYNNADIA